MKTSKLTMILLVAAVALACACSKEAGNDGKLRTITFTADDFILADDALPGTKTSLSGDSGFVWAATDTAGVFPSTGGQVYFTMSSGSNSNSASFDGGGWGLLASENYYSYYPFVGDIYLDRNKIHVSYLGQKQVGASSGAHIGKCDFMYSKGELSGQNLGFNYHHMSCIIRANVTLPAGTYTKLAVTAPTNAFIIKGWYDLMAATPAIVGDMTFNQIGVELESVTSDGTTPFYVYLMSAPVNLQGVEVTISALNSERKEFQCKKTPSRAYDAGMIGGLTCNSWTDVPQSMGLIIDAWGNGEHIGGNAD